jgi:hypothetical protein
VDTTGSDGPGPDEDEEALALSPNGHADEPTPERVPVGAEA